MTAVVVVCCFKESTLEHSSHHNRLVRLCWLLTCSSFSLSVPSVRFTFHTHALSTLQQLLLSTFTAIQTARNVPLVLLESKLTDDNGNNEIDRHRRDPAAQGSEPCVPLLCSSCRQIVIVIFGGSSAPGHDHQVADDFPTRPWWRTPVGPGQGPVEPDRRGAPGAAPGAGVEGVGAEGRAGPAAVVGR